MKTIQEAVESIIRKTPFIEEALNEKLINVSSLARIILPEVDKMLKKQVKVGAVMMAINRISPASELRIRKNIRKFTLSLGDFIVRSCKNLLTRRPYKSILFLLIIYIFIKHVYPILHSISYHSVLVSELYTRA